MAWKFLVEGIPNCLEAFLKKGRCLLFCFKITGLPSGFNYDRKSIGPLQDAAARP